MLDRDPEGRAGQAARVVSGLALELVGEEIGRVHAHVEPQELFVVDLDGRASLGRVAREQLGGQRFLMNEHVGDCWADVLGNRAHGCESVKPTVSPGCVMMLAA